MNLNKCTFLRVIIQKVYKDYSLGKLLHFKAHNTKEIAETTEILGTKCTPVQFRLRHVSYKLFIDDVCFFRGKINKPIRNNQGKTTY